MTTTHTSGKNDDDLDVLASVTDSSGETTRGLEASVNSLMLEEILQAVRRLEQMMDESVSKAENVKLATICLFSRCGQGSTTSRDEVTEQLSETVSVAHIAGTALWWIGQIFRRMLERACGYMKINDSEAFILKAQFMDRSMVS